MASLEQTKVLLCHGSPVLQAGLMALLALHGDFACTESDGAVPLRPARTPPDVVVVDHVRGVAWADALGRMGGQGARPGLLVVTHSDRECDIRAALSSGVQGYLLVDEAPQHLAAAIRTVQLGGRILGPRVASRLADNMAADPLTQREEAVLTLVVEGLCNKLIATRLGITAGTVKSHLRSAFGKLGAASRTHAVAIAHRRGLLGSVVPAPHGQEASPRSPSRPLHVHPTARSPGAVVFDSGTGTSNAFSNAATSA